VGNLGRIGLGVKNLALGVAINGALGGGRNIASIETVCSLQTIMKNCDSLKGYPDRPIVIRFFLLTALANHLRQLW
jgi:hypothetical protein